jgi:hypothetical protein
MRSFYMLVAVLSQPDMPEITRVVSIYYLYRQDMSMVPLTIREAAIYAILALCKRPKKKTLTKRPLHMPVNEHL